MDGRVFYGTDGYYQYEEIDSGWYLTWRLYVSSPTSMAGEIAVAEVGVPCSGGASISFQYFG